MAGALAHWLWIQTLKSQLMAQKLTFAAVQARNQTVLAPTVNQMRSQVMNYLRGAGIGLK